MQQKAGSLKNKTEQTKIQRIIRDDYEELYAIKFNSLEKWTSFLEIYSLPILNYEELENQNRPNSKKIFYNLSKEKYVDTIRSFK